MAEGTSHSADGMHVVDGCLIASVYEEPDDRDLRFLRERILARVENLAIDGVVLDVSRVRILDSVLFGILAETARMITLLGKKAVFMGFQAGLASALVDLDMDLDDLNTALTMEDGLEMLRGRPSQTVNPVEDGPSEQPADADDENPSENQLDESNQGR